VSLLTNRVWRALTPAARRPGPPAAVAVAYFGQGAANLLPLRSGSRLVVDASERTVKSGQTCPAELGKLMKKGVRVYSIQNLHAKVFVLGSTAYIGSANVSRHSSGTLVEAMYSTTDRKTVAAARAFVRDLCIQELGPEAVKQLGKIYRPPRVSGGAGRQRPTKRATTGASLPRVRLAQLSWEDAPEGSEDAEKAGRKIAVLRREVPRHSIDEFWWSGACPFRRWDAVVQVTDEGRGRRLVYPPGTVVHTHPWRRGHKSVTFVYVETPKRRRVDLQRLAKRIGHGAGKRLRRGGLVSGAFAERLLAAWKD